MRQLVMASLMLFGQIIAGQQPLPCVPAAPTDTRPWEYRSRVLESFPPDNPLPRHLGSFRDANRDYRLHLWQDAKGVFGELLSPVLDADSPTSRLYNPQLVSRSGRLIFTVRFPGEQFTFDGQLRGNSLTGRFARGKRIDSVTLRKVVDELDTRK